MLVLAIMTGTLSITFEAQLAISLAIFFIGLFIVFIGGYQFRMKSTTVHPLKPEDSSQLVTAGIYRLSRNPMYAGFFLFLLAWAVFLGSFVTFFVLPVFIIIMNKIQIAHEEMILQQKFGDDYLEYKKRVRRWI